LPEGEDGCSFAAKVHSYDDHRSSLEAEIPASGLSPRGLINPIAMDKGLRFAIREGGRTVGAGQVTEILK
jgi:hypothetical protein